MVFEKKWISLKKCKLFFDTPWEMSHNAFMTTFTSTLLRFPIQVGHKMPMKSPYYSQSRVNALVVTHVDLFKFITVMQNIVVH